MILRVLILLRIELPVATSTPVNVKAVVARVMQLFEFYFRTSRPDLLRSLVLD